MGFFDLNIPYLESSTSKNTTDKTTRVKIVIKAMELGYSGIAYNRTIKGVMSDNDRCSIPLLSLASLLRLAPSLSSSVNFHRDLLGVPLTSAFRQYTRLTVCADTLSKCQVLNTGNPVLKSYDIVAVRPLNQSTFNHVCEKAEVDIISINFADKVPFRLKQPMVKAAIGRGVYFELTYSDLIIDVQLRRQMISNAKLLVDWTRGKNLILSSGAPSVNELRGPYDVANLSSLLGLSVERGKAAVSKNCRTLLTNALRKKHFHKETIRVEAISSSEKFDSNEPWFGDWLKWDPISSGEGDLHLDDMAKSFTASSNVCKTVKAIDFASVIGNLPSQGFQVKDLISGTQTLSQSQDSSKKIFSATEMTNVSVATNGVSEQQSRIDLHPETDQTSSDNASPKHHASGCENVWKLDLPSHLTEMEDIRNHTTNTKFELRDLDVSAELFAAKETEQHDRHSQKCVFSHEGDVAFSKEISKCQSLTRDVELDASCDADTNLEGVTSCDAFDFPASQKEESKISGSSDVDLGVQRVAIGEVRMEIDIKGQEDTSLALDSVSLQENVTEIEHSREPLDDQFVSDQNPFQESYIEIKAKDDISVANLETLEEVTLEEQDVDRLRETGDIRFVANQIPIMESCNEMTIENDSSVANNKAEDELTIEEQRHGEKFREPGDAVVDQILFIDSCNEIRVKNDSSVANDEVSVDVKMEEQIHGEADGKINHPTMLQCVSGKIRKKPRMQHRAILFPLKRLLNPISFKKKARKFKRKIKKA